MVSADPAAFGTPSHSWKPRLRASLVHLGWSVAVAGHAAAIDSAVATTRRAEAALGYVPMIDRQFFWTVLVDRSSAEVVGFLPLDAF